MSGAAPAPAPVLVTGATGFFGSHLAAVLARRGHRVRALARRTSDLSRLAGLDVEIAYGDVRDPDSLRRAAEGRRFVFHSAAKIGDWGPRAQFVEANVEGTRNLVEACRDAGVERLVHVSSLSVLGLPRSRPLITEESPYAAHAGDPYTETKIAAERRVREAHGRGLETVVVRPGVIWGRGDTTILPRFVALLRRRQMVLVDGGQNLIALSHAENLGLGCALAAEVPGAAGRVYHVLDAEQLTAREVLDAIAAAVGAPPARLSVPFAALDALALAMEGAARLLRRSSPPPLTRYGVRLVACDCRYDLSRARAELGYVPQVSFEAGIAELAASLR